MTKTEAELFDIKLDSIERELDADLEGEAYEIAFDCIGRGRHLTATVGLDIEAVTTLEIVPKAMSELNRMFVDLAEQTDAWRIKP